MAIKSQSATISTANTNRNGTGSLTAVCVPGANGATVRSIYMAAQGTTTNGKLHFYIKEGVTYSFVREVQVIAATPSATVLRWQETLALYDFFLESGQELHVGTDNAETFTVTVNYEDA